MLTQNIIAQCDALRPNAYTQEEKLRWLWQFDALMQKQTAHLDVFAIAPQPYTPESELLIEDAFCDIYVKYLLSQIDFANGETGRYNASAVLFNSAYARYLEYLTRRNLPKGRSIIV